MNPMEDIMNPMEDIMNPMEDLRSKTAAAAAGANDAGFRIVSPHGGDRKAKSIEIQDTVAVCFKVLDGGGDPSADSYLCMDTTTLTGDSTFFSCSNLPKTAKDLATDCEVLFQGYDWGKSLW